MPFGRILPRSFYARPAVEVSRDLIGKVLVHGPAAGIIVETEAYLGGEDLAAHSARGITHRTRVIFGPPGHAYVYFIYGMYECLNLVAEPEGQPGCVLIRALEPVAGMDVMQAAARGRTQAAATRQRSRKAHARHGDHAAHNGADVTRGTLVVRHPASTSEIRDRSHAAHRDHAVRRPAAALRDGGQRIRERQKETTDLAYATACGAGCPTSWNHRDSTSSDHSQ